MTHQIVPQRVRSYSYLRKRTGNREYVYWRSDRSVAASQPQPRWRAPRRATKQNLTEALIPIVALVGLITWLYGRSRGGFGL
jgi:hypothetical protein